MAKDPKDPPFNPLNPAEVAAQKARAEERARQRAKLDRRVQGLISALQAQGVKVTDRFRDDYNCDTLEMTSSLFQQEIHRGNLSVYFQPAQSQHELRHNIEGYLEFNKARYIIWVDPESMIGVEAVIGLNKTHL